MLREARRRAAERAAEADPKTWGIAPGTFDLPANDDVAVTPGARGRVLRARRQSDAFQILRASGALGDDAWAASQRYWRDWCLSAGVVERESWRLEAVDQAGSAEGVSQGMIDAGRRLAQAHRHVGRATVRLLTALVEPLVMRGEIRVWRVLVRQATGVEERHAQAALVVQACKDLHYAYADIDREAGRRRKAVLSER